MPETGDNVFDGSWGPVGQMPGESTYRRLLVLLIVDSTKTMEGEAISQVNYGLQELVSELKEYASQNMLNLELGILGFTNSVRWELEPTDVQQCYDVVHINVRPGLTQYGVVYHELNKMLSKERLLNYPGKQAAPVLVFMTDGAPTDDYAQDLQQLQKNGYFALASRSAVIMGEGASDPKAHAAVEKFVSSPNMILTAGNYTEIINSIKLATLHTIRNDFHDQQTQSGTGDTPLPDDIPDENSGGIPGEFPDDIPGEFPDDIPGGIPGEFPDDIPGGIPVDLPDDIPGGIPGDFPDSIPDSDKDEGIPF